ncbi:MAG: hypothetical protein IAF08_03785 [Rhizobacter sp.]|nr:hypothetical protein [Chlorobiales bacterium]
MPETLEASEPGASAEEPRRTIPELDAAIMADPKDVKAYFERGLLKAEAQLTGEAIDDLSKAIELKPDLIEAYSARGLELLYRGELADSLRDFSTVHKAAQAMGMSDVATLFNLGLVYSQMPGKYKETFHYFEKAIKNNRGLLVNYYKSGGDDPTVARLMTLLENTLAKLSDDLAANPKNFYIKQLYDFLNEIQTQAKAAAGK